MNALEFFAGPSALKHIARDGLRPDDIQIVAGAAGGPKWLVLSQLDRAIFGDWMRRREAPLHLIGSSIGAWRFTAVASRDDVHSTIRDFEEAYLAQRYSDKPSIDEVSIGTRKVLDRFLDDAGILRILQQETFRLHVVTTRCRAVMTPDSRPILSAGIGIAILLNSIHRKLLHTLFERHIFSDPRAAVPLAGSHPFRKVDLKKENLRQAVLASGSIPLVMHGERAIKGAKGVHRDGGIFDYHMDMPFQVDEKKLVLFPHFGERVIPGWFDKVLSHRGPKRHHFEKVLLVCPSKEFLASLPFGKIPDRKDFQTFLRRDDERIQYWHKVISECARLHDGFLETVREGKIASRLKAFPFDNIK